MNDIVVQSENLSKLYRLGRHEGYRTLVESLSGAILAPFRAIRSFNGGQRTAANGPAPKDAIWALKDVSFEVGRGEVVGIIGRNGAGKSTLLKIISRVTEPTGGYVKIRGRVGSLLEVGTGFHPELTGRENIYLNGAILGMKKAEIDRKFDEIVAFSELEKFLDTPVKRYSSGMYTRLAFAVAAHLEPEVLLVDEVLAVGDAAFQKKCLGKMGDIARGGRTILFVSHNMQAVSLLCSRTILLDNGKVAADGPTREIVAQYLSTGDKTAGEVVWSFEDAPASEFCKLRAVRVLNAQGNTAADMDIAEPVTVEIEFWCLKTTRMTPSFHFYNQLGMLLFAVANLNDDTWAENDYAPGLYRCRCTIPGDFLNDGTYFVNAYLSSNFLRAPDVRVEPALSFRLYDFQTRKGYRMASSWIGLVRPLLPWAGGRIGDLP